jgi:hypothetical protein
LSLGALTEYDCTKKRVHGLSLTRYSDQMATGRPLWSDDKPGEWEPIVPGSVGAKMLNILCK